MRLFILIFFSYFLVQETQAESFFSKLNPFQKKEKDEFIKYRNHPIYSGYFTKPIRTLDEFKSLLNDYEQYVKNWNARSVYTLNQHIHDLHADVKQPRLFGRIHDLFEYILKQGIYNDIAVKNGIKEFVEKCKVKYPAMAEREIKEGKDLQINEYLFLSATCSKQAFDLLTRSKSAIDQHLGIASTYEKTTKVSPEEDSADERDVVDEKKESLMANRKRCIKSLTPDCLQYVQKVYFATKYRPLINMLYGKGNAFPNIDVGDGTIATLKKCSHSKNIKDPTCATVVRSVVQHIDEVSPNEKVDLTPNPQVYLAENPEKMDELFDESDFKAQAAYQNYNGYKDIKDIRMHIYSAACALDIGFRMRISPTENASFVEKELATSDIEIAKKARSMVSGISDKLSSWKDSDSKVLSSIGKTGSEVVSTNASSDLIENEDIFITPEYIGFYVQGWFDISTQPITLQDGTTTLEELIKKPSPIKVSDLERNNISIGVDYDTLYGILSKICISILGPEYLKAEENLAKAMEEEDSNVFTTKLKDVKKALSDNASQKASRAFRFLPTTEYNKLRQIALIMLTNIHTILLDKRFKKQGKQSPFHHVVGILEDALEEQLSFFARYLYALEQKQYDANSLSTSQFNYSFADIFLEPIYPLQEGDISTLIDADATNLYSLYSSYLLASIHGEVGEESTTDISFDNRSQKKKLLSDFKQKFGLETGLSVKNALSGGIKTILTTITPVPPFISGAISSVATAIIMAGPELIYGKLRQTCRFNKDKCISKKVKSVDLSRPLDVIITEFLISFGHSLQRQIGLEDMNKENDRQFFPLMVTLFEMENEYMRQARNLKAPLINNLSDLIIHLKKRTDYYYSHIGDPVDEHALAKTPTTSADQNTVQQASKNHVNQAEKAQQTPINPTQKSFGKSKFKSMVSGTTFAMKHHPR